MAASIFGFATPFRARIADVLEVITREGIEVSTKILNRLAYTISWDTPFAVGRILRSFIARILAAKAVIPVLGRV